MTAKIIQFPGTYRTTQSGTDHNQRDIPSLSGSNQGPLKFSTGSAEEDRMRRIKEQLERINRLMSDLRDMDRRQRQLDAVFTEDPDE